MRIFAILPIAFLLVNLPVWAQDDVISPVLPDFCQADAADDSGKADGANKAGDAATAKEARREAMRWLNAELKERTHVYALLKKVKDKKSANKVGAALVKEFSKKEPKKTGMGDAEPPKRPTGPVMEECEKKFKFKFSKLDEGISEQLKRIEELEIESDDLKEGLQMLPKYGSASGDES